MSNKSPFDAVVFAGGGSRCFWQVGFWEVVAPELKIRPTVVAGTSAGAAMACVIFADRIHECINIFMDRVSRNPRNFYPGNIVKREPSFPHYEIYRNTIINTLDEKGFKNLKKGPEIRILFARPPRYLGPRSATFVGLLGYVIEKHAMKPVHPKAALRMGFSYEVVPVSSCSTREEVADLILQASCTPPFVPILKRNGGAVLDGGIIDNVPVTAVGENAGKTLLLLTRAYPEKSFPDDSSRLYVGPSRPVIVSKWDYTSPEKIQDTYDLGRRDGEVFIKQWKGRL